MDKFKIFIADDDRDFLEFLEDEILTNEGLTITDRARNGKEALHKLNNLSLTNNFPDLIILDFMMPGADGFEITQAIKNFNTKCPIVILTGFEKKKIELFTKSSNNFEKDWEFNNFSKDVHLLQKTFNFSALNNLIKNYNIQKNFKLSA